MARLGEVDAALQGALRDFLEAPEDAVEGALIVARIVDPSADVDWARAEIARLADAIAEATPAGVVAGMAEAGFRGARERYYEIDNSRLDAVLRARRGIPISLGVALMGVATRLGLPAQGVNFPRHFLVRIGETLVDPFAVAPTSVDACRAWLGENGVRADGAFAVAPPTAIVARMLNNVRLLVHAQRDFPRSLAISDYQLMIAPRAYELHVERADAWRGLNAPEMVVAELETAAECAPDEAIAARLRERAAQAKRSKSVVH